MKNLNELKEEQQLLKGIVSAYEHLEKLKKLTEDEKYEYQNAKDQLNSINKTINNLEVEIEYTKEEMNVFSLPESEQDKAWFNLLKNCDFTKDSILRICSMLKSDGAIPVLRSDGVTISNETADKAVNILREKNIECLSNITKRKLFEVKRKLKNNEDLLEDEFIYKKFLEEYDDIDSNSISMRCLMSTYNYFVSELNKKHEDTGDLEYRADYLLDRVTMALCFGAKLASGEKEFIALYFRDKKAQFKS